MNGDLHDPNFHPIGGFPDSLSQGQDQTADDGELSRTLVYSGEEQDRRSMTRMTWISHRAQLRKAAGISLIAGSFFVSVLGPIGLLAAIGLFTFLSAHIELHKAEI